MLCRFETTA
jgi:hypothetical protein